MKTYKYTDTTNTVVHVIDEDGISRSSMLASLVPEGNTPEPADVPPPPPIQSQIESMEREQLMPRATREFMLMFMEMNAPAEVLAVNPGYQAVKAFDNQIVALRAQLL